MTYDLVGYLNDCRSKNINPDLAVYEACCDIDLARIDLMRKRIEQLRSLKIQKNNKRSKAAKGRLSRHLGIMLERLMLEMLKGCSVLDVRNNVRSTMAEIDYLLGIGPIAASMFAMFRESQPHAIGEAKCVQGAMKTEWINELAGLLPAHGAKLGIIFTAAPSKNLVVGARMTLAIHAARGLSIVPFGFKQVDEVIAGRNFLKVLEEQHARVVSSATDLAI